MKKYNETKFNLAGTRDHLAADRTILANERTLLSYLRLSLTLFVAGMSLIKFFESTIYIIIGIVFMPLTVISGIVGVRRYRRCGKFLMNLKEEKSETVSFTSRRASTRGEGFAEKADPTGEA
ncbi:MAG: DUF202 domain-containing protein [Candidatus Auribacterota bacterium]|nr:DUF202 domain-containing protein [Candidatus Auribacterota bacterium]